MRILFVEDHPLIGEAIRASLQANGFVVDWVRDGVAAREAVSGERYAAMILDLGLPRLPGLDLLRELRDADNRVPVLILTAHGTVADKLAGLNLGADDYVVKPIEIEELVARLHALIRRCGGRSSHLLRAGRVELDPVARRVRVDGVALAMSGRELIILETLLQNAGRTTSRAQIEAAIYGFSDGVESNAVEVHIHYLRKKLGTDLIRTVRGVGYVIDKTG